LRFETKLLARTAIAAAVGVSGAARAEPPPAARPVDVVLPPFPRLLIAAGYSL
jgi:hypothetical protein